LVRFGYEYFETFCQRHQTDLIVISGESLSPEQELVRDLIAIVRQIENKEVLREFKGKICKSI